MARLPEVPVTPEQFRDASKNYLNCLRLAPNAQVLIVTDKMPLNGFPDPHFEARAQMAELLVGAIGKDHKVAKIDFDEAPEDQWLYQHSKEALDQLDSTEKVEGENPPTTIIYLGKKWDNRKNLYKAANDFGKGRLVKMAGSLNFSTGDCRVMSELSEDKIQKVVEANEYFENFFHEKPDGWFKIKTRNTEGEELSLDLSYDTAKAPFESELGHFDGVHETPLGQYPNVRYINIPGGEDYGTPLPFRNANGSFSAEGVTFTVKDGFLIDYKISEGLKADDLTDEQKELIKRTGFAKEQGNVYSGKFLPISELGLGFYALAGIKTHKDSSILTHEKSGPHIAFGNVAEKSTEQDEMEKLSGDFQHADVVLDHPAITWSKIKDGPQEEFYNSTN